MPKKVFFESAVHHFLTAARDLPLLEPMSPEDLARWRAFVASLRFSYSGPRQVQVQWSAPRPGQSGFEVASARFYQHDGRHGGPLGPVAGGADPVQHDNARFFHDVVARIADEAGLNRAVPPVVVAAAVANRIAAEEQFHDQWADAEDLSIDVHLMNEACTAPEMRFITQALGSLRGKSVLDVGCGLGEASVYFALQGAAVTATDISQRMLDRTSDLARRYGVNVRVHQTAAEQMALPQGWQFDVIYAGNLFHHVAIEPALHRILAFLKPTGTLVSWDPVAYNPLINVYRRIATEVRTKDEHPLRLKDLRLFKRYFGDVRVRWFWLTTLAIFVFMAAVERRSPNKERYWKTVITESGRWERLYRPLERLDQALLAVAPFLRPLCWNVVVIAGKPRPAASR